MPGTTIELPEVQEAAGQFVLRANGSERAIAEKAAAGLYVRPE